MSDQVGFLRRDVRIRRWWLWAVIPFLLGAPFPDTWFYTVTTWIAWAVVLAAAATWIRDNWDGD